MLGKGGSGYLKEMAKLRKIHVRKARAAGWRYIDLGAVSLMIDRRRGAARWKDRRIMIGWQAEKLLECLDRISPVSDFTYSQIALSATLTKSLNLGDRSFPTVVRLFSWHHVAELALEDLRLRGVSITGKVSSVRGVYLEDRYKGARKGGMDPLSQYYLEEGFVGLNEWVSA